MKTSRRTTSAVLGLTVASLLLAGCGGGGGADKKFDANKVTALTPAAKGGVDSIKWGLTGSEPVTLDPIKIASLQQNTIGSNLCESLLQLQPDFSLKPGLAEKYDQVDPKTLVFTIRDGVTFWNGDALTADDVAFSLNRNLKDPEAANGFLYSRVASIKATGPLEVTVRFTEPDANFLSALSGLSGAVSQKSFVEKAAKDYGNAGTGVMCTGPYKLGTWKTGQGVQIVANEAYWNPDLKPKVKSITFDAIVENSTLATALRSGALDGAYEVPPSALSSLSKAGGNLYYGPSTEYFLFGAVDPKGPAADLRVRKALELALDRKAFVKNTLKGAGEPLKTFTPPFAISGSPAKKTLEDGYKALDGSNTADIPAAKKLIDGANLKDKDLTIAISAGDQVALSAATLMQAAGKQIGLSMKIKQLQDSQELELFFNPASRAGIDLLGSSGYYESPVFLSYAGAFVNPDGLGNFIGYDNPEAAAALAKSINSTDPEQSAAAFVEGQKIWHKDRLAIPVAIQYERLYLRKGLTGAPASQAYVSYPWAAKLGAS